MRAGSLSTSPYQQSGSDGDLHGRFASTGGAYPDNSSSSTQPPSMRSLATRSQNPHLPPVAPVAPSLYTISTGFNAYAAAAAAAAGASGSGNDGRGRDGCKKSMEAGISRSLGAKSVPAAQAAAAMAAAAARGRMGPSPAAAGASSFSDQLTTISSVGPTPAPPAAAAAVAAAAGASLSKNSGGGLLDSVKRGISKMSVSLGKGSRVSRSASGVAGDSSDDESGYNSLYKSSAFASSKGDAAANEEELADARHWLVSGGHCCCFLHI